ncbi:MAG TPA: ABC transporter permease subunit [Vicinamibacterales bacterium]|nr:ABC transporter permease subunit [Vicinamibacterales bacterium]
MSGVRFFRVVRLCAAQERTLAVRSRWTQIFAIVFTALALAVAGSGYILSGGYGVQDFSRTAVSLVQLVLLLVPLSALLLGVMALLPDRGAAELLYSQPVSRAAILLGTMAGLFVALTAAQAIGLGAAGLVIYSQSGNEGASSFAWLFLLAVALTAIFLGLAGWICAGTFGQRRSRALALAIAVWFVLVVLFDVVVVGVASLLPSGNASRLLIGAALANPVDALRTGTLLAIEGTAAFGSSSLALLRFTQGPAGAAALIASSAVLWLVVPVWLASWRLSRADI